MNTGLHGPEFGSYTGQQVTWLLKDLSSAPLEAPTGEREYLIQSGAAHYAQSLPQEKEPSKHYLAAYTKALEDNARKVAAAVGVLAERAMLERGGAPVLVSLARAGTPIGILMKAWMEKFHGYSPAHYAVSIVRGVGIDENALDYIAQHHDPSSVLFVDGWTGKGAISRQLDESIQQYTQRTGAQFDPQLAVLADPGSCSDFYGTREDFLVPSACLNSTVSGLISRTVLNEQLIEPTEFHGAKFYRHFAQVDQSQKFIQSISQEFNDQLRGTVIKELASGALDCSPTWEGWKTVERIGQQYGISNLNLIKPGVGETTRVLLRRVPFKVLMNPGAALQLEHIKVLAQAKNVEIIEVPQLAYACVGLIKPTEMDG